MHHFRRVFHSTAVQWVIGKGHKTTNTQMKLKINAQQNNSASRHCLSVVKKYVGSKFQIPDGQTNLNNWIIVCYLNGRIKLKKLKTALLSQLFRPLSEYRLNRPQFWPLFEHQKWSDEQYLLFECLIVTWLVRTLVP